MTNPAPWPLPEGTTRQEGEKGLPSQDVAFFRDLVFEERSRKRLHLGLYLRPLHGSSGLLRPLSLVLGHLATDSACDFLLLFLPLFCTKEHRSEWTKRGRKKNFIGTILVNVIPERHDEKKSSSSVGRGGRIASYLMFRGKGEEGSGKMDVIEESFANRIGNM